MPRSRILVLAVATMTLFPLAATAVELSDQDAPALSDLIGSFLSENAPEALADPGPIGAPLSPFGGTSSLAPEALSHAILTSSFQFVINPTGAPVFADPDFDGTPDFTGDLLRAAVNGQLTADPLGMPYQNVVSNGLIPALGSTPVISVQDTFRELGLDPTVSGPQDLNGTQVVIVSSPGATENPLQTVPVLVFGGSIDGGLPVEDCGGNIIELGRADARTSGPLWEPGDFAPNDIFTGTTRALVTRCQGADGWTVLAFDNTGTSFVPAGTGMHTLIHPNGFISFLPGHELAGANGGRIFSFVTPEAGGYQPDNTAFTSYPAFPSLTDEPPAIVVMDPFHGTGPLGVYPLELGFSGGSPDSSNCGAESWTGLFELYAWEGSDGVLDGALYQFASGQRTMGTIEVDGGLTIDTSGGGDGYTESFALSGPGGSYTYRPGDVECPFEVTVISGYDPALADLIAVTTVEETPSDDEVVVPVTPTPETPSVDDGAAVVATEPGDTEGGGLAVPLIVVGGTLIVGGTYLTLRRRPVTVDAGGPATTVTTPPPSAATAPDKGDLWMQAFIGGFGGAPPAETATGAPDHLSEANWRHAVHLEEQAQAKIESSVQKAFEGDGSTPGVYDAFRRYLAAVDGFQTTFTRLLSSTTEFQGLLQRWAEVQQIARNQDLAFALVQLAWGGFSLSRWINAPTHIPWHRSTLSGRMLASGSGAGRTATAAGSATAGGAKVGDALTDTGRGADAATDTGRGLDLFPPSPQAAARTARQKTNIPKVQGIPNVHSVYVHGSRTGQFVTDSGKVISLERVAGIIEASPGYRVGKGVRLVSCWSGSTGLASKLARKLGTWVMAPTHPVGLNGNGRLLFRSEELAQGAHWIVFDPSGVARYRVFQNGARVPIVAAP